MKVLSLFDGISVAQQALKELGAKDLTYFASEIDKYAIAIAKKNHPNMIHIGSVTEVAKEMVGKVDLLIGGSPCQDLSIANKGRQGLDGERSGLFWEYVRILKEVKPKYFVLENVNSMPKEAKAIITEALGVEPIMINASLVSAQNRKRLFWTNIPNVTLPEDRNILLKDILEKDVDEKYNVPNYNPIWKSDKPIPEDKDKYRTLRTGGQTPTVRLGQIGKGGQGYRIYSPDGKSVGLSALSGGIGAHTGLYAVGVASRTYPRTPNGEKRTKRIEVRKDERSNALTSLSSDSMVMQNGIIRKLTLIECERLQSLPDNYTDGVSDNQRYKMCGNAFNCEVIKHIIKSIL